MSSSTPVTISGRAVKKAERLIRKWSDRQRFYSACYAPMSSMYFDQHGKVRACCQNTGSLYGDVRKQTIREIWESDATNRIREALKQDDYSEGCGFCKWQIDEGNTDLVFARNFDKPVVKSERPTWPLKMEFSMTNSCNLQCEMCNGDWSSSIRIHREGREPLPEVYGDKFFEELEEFLPHLREVNILGGEPFLGKEPLRLMEMLSELKSPPKVCVTTNGTQMTPRVEAILEKLPLDLVVSLDGITKETYESIRIGANFEEVMANLEVLRSYAAHHKKGVSLAHCLMRTNYHEFADFLTYAEAHGHGIGLNQVLFPIGMSLFQLDVRGLRSVIEQMEDEQGDIAAKLVTHRHLWDEQLDALKNRLRILEAGATTFVAPWAADESRAETGDDESQNGDALIEDSADQAAWEELAGEILTEWTGLGRRPWRLRITDSGSVDLGDLSSDFDLRDDLAAAASVDEMLEVLSLPLGGTSAVRMLETDFLYDAFISDPTGDQDLEFRLMWSVRAGEVLALLAYRYPGIPVDARAELEESFGPDRILQMDFDPEGQLVEVDGDPALLALTGEQVRHCDADDLFVSLRAKFGDSVQLSPGPSGYSADALLTLSDEHGVERLRVRSMVDEQEDGSKTILVGVAETKPVGQTG